MTILFFVLSALTLSACLIYAGTIAIRHLSYIIQAKDLHQQERQLLSDQIARLTDPVGIVQSKSGQLAWDGFRKFVLQGKILESEGVCSFYFIPHDKKPLPPFLPGQYLTFRINVPGQKNLVTRCYSLSDSPNHPDYYRVTVKKIPPPHDKPELNPGLLSNYFHQKLNADDIVDIKAPSGQFHLDAEHMDPVVLIGGGIGLTPVLSMLNHIVATGAHRETWFFYGIRNSSEHVMLDHLVSINNEHENINLAVCYSDPMPDDLLGKHYNYAERVSVELFKRVLPSNNYEFYICGPPPMMDSITNDLSKWGVPDSKIHFEAFGPATVKKVISHEATLIAQTSGISINFAKSKKDVVWNGMSSCLLDFAESSGIAMESGCRAGNCGTCSIAIRSGEVEYLSAPGAIVEQGSCLTCISVPKTDLVLDV